jgi:ankyrin repeat protein
VNAKTNKGVTAMMIAFNRSEDEIVQLLKEAGAKE